MQKILIADDSAEFNIILSGALRARFQVEVCADGRLALERLRACPVDVLVVDLLVPGMDGMELLRRVHEEHLASAVVVLSLFYSDYTATALMHYGVDYAARKPCSVAVLTDRVVELCAGVSAQPEPDSYGSVSGILLSLGFQTHLRGFSYCRDSILSIARTPGQQVTKNIYPDVGKHYGANGQAVEKAIRTAIAGAWEQRCEDVWRMYFPSAPGGKIPRPTNTEFLTRIADSIAAERRIG